MSCGTTDKPSPDGYAVECGGTLAARCRIPGRWVARDSGGKANVVAVSIPQFTALVTITDWFKHNFTRSARAASSTSSTSRSTTSARDASASKVVAYLQSHPDINYVLFTFADLAAGSAQAIRAAGLSSKVKLIGAVENASIVKGVPATYKAWTLSPNEYMGMVMVDAAARLSVGEPLTGQYQTEIYHNPTWILDSAPEAKALSATSNTWPGPTGYVQQFEHLWKVGG